MAKWSHTETTFGSSDNSDAEVFRAAWEGAAPVSSGLRTPVPDHASHEAVLAQEIMDYAFADGVARVRRGRRSHWE